MKWKALFLFFISAFVFSIIFIQYGMMPIWIKSYPNSPVSFTHLLVEQQPYGRPYEYLRVEVLKSPSPNSDQYLLNYKAKCYTCEVEENIEIDPKIIFKLLQDWQDLDFLESGVEDPFFYDYNCYREAYIEFSWLFFSKNINIAMSGFFHNTSDFYFNEMLHKVSLQSISPEISDLEINESALYKYLAKKNQPFYLLFSILENDLKKKYSKCSCEWFSPCSVPGQSH